MNDIQALIQARRTIHDYTTEPLPQGALERALEAARFAPNHKLTNPWRFTIFGEQARQRIAQLGVQLKCPDRPAEDPLAQKVYNKFSKPAELLLISQVLDPDPGRANEDYAAIACAIQNMSLSLWAEGVGTKWSTGGITRHEEVLSLAQLPANERSVGFLWVGIPELMPKTPPRLALEQLVRRTS